MPKGKLPARKKSEAVTVVAVPAAPSPVAQSVSAPPVANSVVNAEMALAATEAKATPRVLASVQQFFSADKKKSEAPAVKAEEKKEAKK